MRALVYQIGRLEFNAFNKITFFLDQDEFETFLSSFAIRDFLKKKQYEVVNVLLFPVSLPFNSSLTKNEKFKANCNDECYEALQNAINNPYKYLKLPEMFFEAHPHSAEAKNFRIIHSIGKYETSIGQISFNTFYSDIVLTILMDMIKRYLEDEGNFEKILIDISSGHNIYISALIEALRHFAVWLKLYRWNGKLPSIEIAFSEPIIPGSKHEKCKIYFEPQNVKSFFTSPIKHDDIEGYLLSRAIYPEKIRREDKNKIQSMLKSFVLTFSAIKNNTPLAIYEFGYHEPQEILKVFRDLMVYTEEKLTEGYDSSPNLNKNDYLKAFLALGFYCGISNLLKVNNILKINSDGIEIGGIRVSFKKVNDIF